MTRQTGTERSATLEEIATLVNGLDREFTTLNRIERKVKDLEQIYKKKGIRPPRELSSAGKLLYQAADAYAGYSRKLTGLAERFAALGKQNGK